MPNDADDLDALIEGLFKKSKYWWRTPKGIASELGVPTKAVSDRLFAASQFLELPGITKDGQARFTTRDRFLSEASPLEKLAGGFKNRLF